MGLLKTPGDAVLIERGRPRWLLLLCPCGCGDELPINLDGRAGPAWKLYRNKGGEVSLYPSVWRDSGCESHFIIRRNSITLFGQYEDSLFLNTRSDWRALVQLTREKLPSETYASFVDVAESIDEIPWDVLDACRQLVREGVAIEGAGKDRCTFKKHVWMRRDGQ